MSCPAPDTSSAAIGEGVGHSLSYPTSSPKWGEICECFPPALIHFQIHPALLGEY